MSSVHHYHQSTKGLARATVGGAVGATGNDAFTTVLLHMDGDDAGTTFSDSNFGGSAHTWTAAGNAQIDTAESKFGGASGLFDGTGDCLTTPDSGDWDFGSGDFTIDLWFNRAGGNGTERIMLCQCNLDADLISFYVELSTANRAKASIRQSDLTVCTVTGTTSFTAAGWHHVAFVRTGDTLKLFVDGTQEGGDVAISGATRNSSAKLGVGRFGDFDGLYWNGWLDEIRISKGIARWTANFTPPTSAYGP
jgi:hypothetical protein